jgi:hypothetical protein
LPAANQPADVKLVMKVTASGGARGENSLGEDTNMPRSGRPMSSGRSAKEVVLAYIHAMDSRDYSSARKYLGDNVRVKGPGGEAFRSPDDFLSMMQNQQGKYDLKKVFVDGDDVCLLYDFKTKTVTTFFSSWYQVEDGKIVSIQTVFDPRAFAAAQAG